MSKKKPDHEKVQTWEKDVTRKVSRRKRRPDKGVVREWFASRRDVKRKG